MKFHMDGFHKLQDDLEKVIEKDGSSSVTDDDDESKHEQTVRECVSHAIHTNKFQICIIILVILDCLLVVVELLLDLRVFELPDHENHIAPKILHYCSIAILSIFMVEIIVRIYVLRLDFFKNKLEMFDSVVVIISFVLDIVYRDQEGAANGIGLLIVLRLWRVTRILNGIVLSVKRQAEKRLLHEHRLRLTCEQELAKFREYCAVQEYEIEKLKDLLRKNNINFVEKQEQPPVSSTIDVVAEVNGPIHDSEPTSAEEVKENSSDPS